MGPGEGKNETYVRSGREGGPVCSFVVRSFVRDAGAAPVWWSVMVVLLVPFAVFSVRVFCHECVCCLISRARFVFFAFCPAIWRKSASSLWNGQSH